MIIFSFYATVAIVVGAVVALATWEVKDQIRDL
jgi:hypothetical protein